MNPDDKKSYTLREIAARLGGRVEGDGGVLIEQVASMENAVSRQITFLTHAKFRKQLAATRADAVILGHADAAATALPRIVCDNPLAYFARVAALLNPRPRPAAGIHPTAQVAASARVAPSASVGAFVSIGQNARIGDHCIIHAGCMIGDDVTLGAGTLLYPRVVIYHDCELGERVILHAGVVIGADGFGLAMEHASGADPETGRWLKIPQIGRVIIGADVEIGANTTVDRGALDDTVIEEGVKLDNQIQIGHNVRIGAHTAIAACAGIAGSTHIGRHCRIGGAAMIVGHIKIADHVNISGGTLIAKSISNPETYTGAFPSSPHAQWLKNSAHLRHLDDLAEKLHRMEKEIEELKGKKT